MTNKTGVIVQARVSSMRLPAKILKELPYGKGITVLEQVLRRLKKASSLQEIVVATTTEPEDEACISLAKKEGVQSFVGSRDDVLARYFQAAKSFKLDTIVRVTSDCPCIDPVIIDRVVSWHRQQKADYTSNTMKRTFLHGLDTEVFSFGALEKSHALAKQQSEREHVTAFMYRNPTKFACCSFEAPAGQFDPGVRVTLDTIEDYVLLCAVYDYLYMKDPCFNAQDVNSLFIQKPWLRMINSNVIQKKVLNTDSEEVQEALRVLEQQGLQKAKAFLTAYAKEHSAGIVP